MRMPHQDLLIFFKQINLPSNAPRRYRRRWFKSRTQAQMIHIRHCVQKITDARLMADINTMKRMAQQKDIPVHQRYDDSAQPRPALRLKLAPTP